mmetsp:Transcript_17962/g.55817  ORF Transcript_17962/g.55817 Transcript_17962/m.55817 type:complete len:218 (+) Transcript_17962:192-845(+)
MPWSSASVKPWPGPAGCDSDVSEFILASKSFRRAVKYSTCCRRDSWFSSMSRRRRCMFLLAVSRFSVDAWNMAAYVRAVGSSARVPARNSFSSATRFCCTLSSCSCAWKRWYTDSFMRSSSVSEATSPSSLFTSCMSMPCWYSYAERFSSHSCSTVCAALRWLRSSTIFGASSSRCWWISLLMFWTMAESSSSVCALTCSTAAFSSPTLLSCSARAT